MAVRLFTDLLVHSEDNEEVVTCDPQPAEGVQMKASDVRQEDQLLEFIERDVIGSDAVISTVFGERQILYADYTASGRALRCFEDYIRSEVLPLYANTHTTASATGTQSTLFRAEARDIILRCVGGERTKDAVLFTGTGCTGAVVKLVHLLSHSDGWHRSIAAGHPPLVLIGAPPRGIDPPAGAGNA